MPIAPKAFPVDLKPGLFLPDQPLSGSIQSLYLFILFIGSQYLVWQTEHSSGHDQIACWCKKIRHHPTEHDSRNGAQACLSGWPACCNSRHEADLRGKGEAKMKKLKEGSTVSVHYIGTLDNGRTFHSTPDDQPLVFTIGAKEVFPALEEAVAGMAVGGVRNLVIPAADAYGPRLQENIISMDRANFPPEKELRVGQKLAVEFRGDKKLVMMVMEVTDSKVTLDGNHPLAGHDLTFALRLDAVN
jgi:peptidylprolyl isomerase